MNANLGIYLPQDRREALARGETLPDRARGAVLFADISGFTPLTEALAGNRQPRPAGLDDACAGVGPESPQLDYFVCYQVFTATQEHEAAHASLRSTYQLVMARPVGAKSAMYCMGGNGSS